MKAASELLGAIRGRRSQASFAKRLGYRSNPITDWENGRTYPTASETLRILARLRFPTEQVFAPFQPARPPSAAANWAVGGWLDALRGSSSIVDVAQRAQWSRFAVSRCLSGKGSPRLPDFLHLLDAITDRAAEWVAAIVPIEQVPSLKLQYQRVRAARHVAIDFPWSEAIMRLMETRAYVRLTGDAQVEFIAGALRLDSSRQRFGERPGPHRGSNARRISRDTWHRRGE